MDNKAKTLGHLLLKKIKNNKNKKVIGWINKGHLKYLSYSEYKEIIESLSLALEKLGLNPQEKISILGTTSKEWHFFDMASLATRAIVIPIYPTYTSEEIEYILNNSESKFIVVENSSQLNKVIECQKNLKNLEVIISLENISDDIAKKLDSKFKYYTYSQLRVIGTDLAKENPNNFYESLQSIKEDDIATIVYTSGTTGEPKGAVITHKAFATMLENLSQFLKGQINSEDKTLTFLPLSHVLGRCDSLLFISLGLVNIYAESIERVIENLAIARPTIMIAVPRIFEKIYSKVMLSIEEGSFVKRKVFDWALDASEKYYHKIDQDLSPTASEMIQKNLAYKLVFSKIYERFGGKIRFFVSGGAPLSPKIQNFLKYANLTILEGYGLTETIAPCTLNPTHKQVSGTVGLPIGDVQIKFDSDGEILIKSDALFSNYFKNEEETAKVFADGWFKTGDIGKLTSEGHLQITDRKKDIIITSGGKNVAPQKIENLIKTQKYIANFMCIGDKQKYLTGLVSIDLEDFNGEELAQAGLSKTDSLSKFSESSVIKDLVKNSIENVNEELPNFETIKKFYIVDEDFTIENGLLTPSMKLKKKNVLKRFENDINAMY